MNTVGIVGLGYVGLPLALQVANKNYNVYGVDLDQAIVDKVKRRESPYANDHHFERSLKTLKTNSLTASTSFADLAQCDVIIICVPTPTIDNIPDLSHVLNATKQVAIHLRPGQLIVLESTVNPGVTRDEVLPLLEEASGLKVGKDFYLAHCPERIDPGNDTYFVGNINRVVGGITPKCTTTATAFYKDIIEAEVIPLGSTEEAEFVKSWENTHRNVLIALANNAAIICDALNMDIDNILKGMESKVRQFGLSLAKPGIGPGGHCIPEDIHYVIKKAEEHGVNTHVLQASTKLNDDMPHYALRKLEAIVVANGQDLKDLRVGLLGLSYKPNIADARKSPAIKLGRLLVPEVKELLVHDPHVHATDLVPGSHKVTRIEELLSKVDVLCIATAHSEYIELLTQEVLTQHGVAYVLDGRNALDKASLHTAGIHYVGIGR